MVSNVQKGRIVENKARDLLVAEGYNIVFKSQRVKFGNIDFAHLFDIVAFKHSFAFQRFISVKTYVSESRHKPHIKEVTEFAELYRTGNQSFEVWLWDNKFKQWDFRAC